MPRVSFNQLPPDARLWIFAAERPLEEFEQQRLLDAVDQFIDQWGAHAVPLSALVRQMRTLQAELGAELVNHGPVLFRRGDVIERIPREAFAKLAASGKVSLNTTVFNNTVTSLGDVRAGRWEVPVSESWHAQAFF